MERHSPWTRPSTPPPSSFIVTQVLLLCGLPPHMFCSGPFFPFLLTQARALENLFILTHPPALNVFPIWKTCSGGAHTSSCCCSFTLGYGRAVVQLLKNATTRGYGRYGDVVHRLQPLTCKYLIHSVTVIVDGSCLGLELLLKTQTGGKVLIT